MSRYKATKMNKMKSTKGNVRGNIKSMRYLTTIYPKVPERDTDIYVITQPGDRLDNLSLVFYGDPSYWWFIAHVNNLSALNVETGISLRIPASIEDAIGK